MLKSAKQAARISAKPESLRFVSRAEAYGILQARRLDELDGVGPRASSPVLGAPVRVS